MTAEGVTNDKEARPPLNAGGAAQVSGIRLKSGQTGSVTTQCA